MTQPLVEISRSKDYNSKISSLSVVNVQQKPLSLSGFSCMNIWLKICSYTMCICYIFAIFVLITVGMGFAYYITYENWYDHIVQSVWVISTYIIFYFMHSNTKQTKFTSFTSHNDHNQIEYYIVSLSFMFIIILIRFGPIFVQNICPSSSKPDNILSTIPGFMVNMITMYPLDFILLYLSLVIVRKYEQLEHKIKTNINIHMDDILNTYEQITNDVILFNKNWEFVVSISCFYHLLLVGVYGGVWITNRQSGSGSLFVHCKGNEWAQLFIVNIRACTRIFGLLYGILKLNHKPQQLAEIINKYCHWKNELQQLNMQRLVLNLIEFPDRFRVIGVKVQWKHFVAVMITVIGTALGALASTKLASVV
eukprot:491217_1